MGEAGLFGDQGPEQVHHAPGQPADGDHGGRPAGEVFCGLQGIIVRGSQGSLGYPDQNDIAGQPALQEMEQPAGAGGGFTRAGGAFQEGVTLQGRGADGLLGLGGGGQRGSLLWSVSLRRRAVAPLVCWGAACCASHLIYPVF